jgi:Bacterial Ig-like domain (group 3)
MPFFRCKGKAASIKLVSKYSTATTVSSSVNPSNYGQPVTITAQVSSADSTAPTGMVAFYDNGTRLGEEALSPDGTASLSTAKLPNIPGGTALSVVYEGDSQNAGSTSSALTQIVNQAQIAISSLVPSKNPTTQQEYTHGPSVEFTATVTSNGGMPKGYPMQLINADTGAVLGSAEVTATGVVHFWGILFPYPGTVHVEAVLTINNSEYGQATSEIISEQVNPGKCLRSCV